MTCLLVTVLVIFMLPAFLPERSIPPLPVPAMVLEKDPERINAFPSNEPREPVVSNYTTSFTGFYFDPNLIEAEGWKKLGLRDRTIRTIMNYRSKGGKFRAPEDLKKIYGLTEQEFARLKSFVRIKETNPYSSFKRPVEIKIFAVSDKKLPERIPVKKLIVDINLADTSAWIALPGIGSKLSLRIVTFREKLGGFYSVDQVAQTFGLQDSVFQRIKPMLILSAIAIKKLNINKASEEELKIHPYVRWQLAKAIIAFRNEHGEFKKLEALKNIMAFSEEAYNKVAPYLEL